MSVIPRVQRGYTLIELMVSMTIFAMVMLAASAAYLSFIAYNRQAQATAAVMNSLSFTIDSMAREIRSGTGYSATATSVTFTNAENCAVTYAWSSGNPITRSVTNLNGNCTQTEIVASPITDSPTVVVKNFKIVRRGVKGGPQPLQPLVVIDINGYANILNTGAAPTKVPFQIETAATQRLPWL